jgi:1-acyl-sn-glycerol-3-phosphate acyltransferase
VLKLVYLTLKTFLAVLVGLFLKDVKGIENIPKKGPFILVSNHNSSLDPYLLDHYIIKKTNQKVHFIAYTERFAYLGNFLIKKWAGCIPIRYNKKEISIAMEEAVSILKKGGIVGICPTAASRDLSKFKTGAARIALAAKCPVLPAIIKGTEEIMPLPSLMPRRFKHASIQYKKLMTFKKTEKDVKLVTKKIAQVISGELEQ